MSQSAADDPFDRAGGMFGRRLPHNIECEMALLGSILVSNRAFERIADFLDASHFAYLPHQRVFAACRALIENGHIADPVTLSGAIARDSSFNDIGGTGYLLKLADAAVAVVNARDYGKLILDLYQRRVLIKAGNRLVDRAYDLEGSSDDIIGAATSEILGIAGGGQAIALRPFSSATQGAVAACDAAMRGDVSFVPIETGLADFDRKFGGFAPGRYSIIAARPGSGKSVFGLTVALAAARMGVKVSVISVEMLERDLGARALAGVSGLESNAIVFGSIHVDDMATLLRAKQELDTLPIQITDSWSVTPGLVRLWAADMARRNAGERSLIVIDYLQLLEPPDGMERANKAEKISAISGAMKAAAKDTGVAFVCLAQMSRSVEMRTNPRPVLSDLAESGSLERDADTVLFLHRPEMFIEREEPDASQEKKHAEWQKRLDAARNVVEIYVEKNRHGRLGSVKVFFDKPHQKFTNLARQEEIEQL